MDKRMAVHDSLMQFNSRLQEDLLLVEIFHADGAFVVKVFGDEEVTFSSYDEAVTYAEKKNDEFYM
jgi:hypothetical protein